MESVIASLFWILAVAAPFAGYFHASHKPNATRRQILAGAILGGTTVGLLIILIAVFQTSPAEWADALPYAFISVCYGAVVGICGLIARQLGAWLAGRP